MAVTAQGSGTTAALTIGTPVTLLDVAIAGTFTLHVDLFNMAAGDGLELRTYQIILTGGTRRVVYKTSRYDAQNADDMIAISVPVSNELTDAGSLRFEILQTLGTGRTFAWKVLRYA